MKCFEIKAEMMNTYVVQSSGEGPRRLKKEKAMKIREQGEAAIRKKKNR